MKSFSPIRKIVRRFTAAVQWTTTALLLHKNNSTSASTSIGIESRVNFCSGCLMLFQERNTIMQTVKPKLNQ